MSPLALNQTTFPKVVTVVDASIATTTVPLALHALSSSSTVFLSGSDLLQYLRSVETEDVKLQELDLQNLDTAAPAAAAAAAPKEDARIEGAVQIAIGVKKEVDFPTWYTNVRFTHLSIIYTLKTTSR